MEGDSLRSAIDIYALQITVALDNSLGIEAVILHQYRIAVGIIGVMVVADLRRGFRYGYRHYKCNVLISKSHSL